MKKLTFFALILMAGLMACEKETEHPTPRPIPEWSSDFYKKVDYSDPYKLRILNEHRVACISKKDTVYLYLENAYVLCEEQLLFIEK